LCNNHHHHHHHDHHPRRLHNDITTTTITTTTHVSLTALSSPIIPKQNSFSSSVTHTHVRRFITSVPVMYHERHTRNTLEAHAINACLPAAAAAEHINSQLNSEKKQQRQEKM